MMHMHEGYDRAMATPVEEQAPGWVSGLRSLYRPVTDEPILPDFRELLARIERDSRHGAAS